MAIITLMKMYYPRGLIVFFAVFTFQAQASGISNFSQVEEGLYRGSQPSSKTDYQKLKNIGIKTILSLEAFPTWVENLKATANGFDFINVGFVSLNPRISTRKINKVIHILKDESLRPLYVHCRFGRDRTGVMIGLYRMQVHGWNSQEAYKEMQDFGFRWAGAWGPYRYFQAFLNLNHPPLTAESSAEDY